ncbi:Bacteroidetes-specific putative membrane protein [Ancylostoma ceylanicum]|uniref:Bacteroidetes-specific putative membrane protein n=1 Tax=Ancylostoma ceylanicum TaxID=53326 RepID=A0A0D6L421_9BILA|nr:Bacteroidetes-specific putative membrane protein [Ancylostoma ceylanicum]
MANAQQQVQFTQYMYNTMMVNPAYAGTGARIPLSEKIRLSVGLNGGMDIVNVDWSKGQAQSDNDAVMLNNIRNRVRPVVGAGIYLYADNWYFGLSSPTFIQKDSYGKWNEAEIDPRVHWYAIAGYVFSIGDNVKLKPAVLAKMVKGAPITADVSLNTLIKEQFTGIRTI